MAVGNFFLFDRALLKLQDGTINLESMALKAVLTDIAQPLDKTFTGSSGDARYADLTAELSTANGYTAGGVSLSGVTLSRPTALIAQLTASNWSWTITSTGITFKYCVLFVGGATNDDLLAVVDCEDTGGSLILAAGPLVITPNANGIIDWTQ